MFTGALFIYHLSLIYKSLSTKEEMRINPLKNILNSYLRGGFWGNFVSSIFPNVSKISLLHKLKIRFNELDKVLNNLKKKFMLLF